MMTTKRGIPQAPVKPIVPHPFQRNMWLAALIVMLTMAVGAIALFMGARAILRSVPVGERADFQQGKVVPSRTPVGGIRVWQAMQADEANLGLPVYPGAEQVKSYNSARAPVDPLGHEAGGVIEEIYQTSDPASKVRSFYQANLGGLSKFTEQDAAGRMTFDLRKGNQQKIIVLKAASGGTRIELIRIHYGATQAN